MPRLTWASAALFGVVSGALLDLSMSSFILLLVALIVHGECARADQKQGR